MRSSKLFFERIKNDGAFAKEVSDAFIAKKEAGASNYYETIIPVAAEYGYDVSKEDLDAIYEAQTSELSGEELGKVAGGTSCIGALIVTSISATIIGASLSVNYSLQKLLE